MGHTLLSLAYSVFNGLPNKMNTHAKTLTCDSVQAWGRMEHSYSANASRTLADWKLHMLNLLLFYLFFLIQSHQTFGLGDEERRVISIWESSAHLCIHLSIQVRSGQSMASLCIVDSLRNQIKIFKKWGINYYLD
jgi:hypothetical protein